MTIIIRDQAIEERIRAIVDATGESPDAVIARALESLEWKSRPISKAEALAKLERLNKLAPPRNPHLAWKDVEAMMDDIF